jgi:putative hydrolase of the HAD superfamily
MIRAVLWDFGGVLMRTEDGEPRTRLAEQYGLSRGALERLLWGNAAADQATLGAVSTDQHWQWVADQLGLPAAEIPALREQFFAGDRLDQQLVGWIRELRRYHRTGLISNAFDDLRPLLEDTLQIADAFDVLVISAEEGLKKPEPGIFHIALQRLGIRPPEAVFVDDFIENVQAARAVGLLAVHFRGPDQARREVEALLHEHGAAHR